MAKIVDTHASPNMLRVQAHDLNGVNNDLHSQPDGLIIPNRVAPIFATAQTRVVIELKRPSRAGIQTAHWTAHDYIHLSASIRPAAY